MGKSASIYKGNKELLYLGLGETIWERWFVDWAKKNGINPYRNPDSVFEVSVPFGKDALRLLAAKCMTFLDNYTNSIDDLMRFITVQGFEPSEDSEYNTTRYMTGNRDLDDILTAAVELPNLYGNHDWDKCPTLRFVAG
jgi:hypothetical protein